MIKSILKLSIAALLLCSGIFASAADGSLPDAEVGPSIASLNTRLGGLFEVDKSLFCRDCKIRAVNFFVSYFLKSTKQEKLTVWATSARALLTTTEDLTSETRLQRFNLTEFWDCFGVSILPSCTGCPNCILLRDFVTNLSATKLDALTAWASDAAKLAQTKPA